MPLLLVGDVEDRGSEQTGGTSDGVQLNVSMWGWSTARGLWYPTASTDSARRACGCDAEIETRAMCASAVWFV